MIRRWIAYYIERVADTMGAIVFGWHMPQPSDMRKHPTGQGIGNIGGEPIPDRIATEPLVGYRAWRVMNNGDGTGIRLASMHMSYFWKRQNTAVCNPVGMMFSEGTHPKIASPAPDCACGLYAQLPEQPITEWLYMMAGSVTASGTIAMSGRIIRCERGYKAQHAELQSPIILEASCVHGCDNMPTIVQLPEKPVHMYWTVCDEHKSLEPRQMPTVTVGLDEWMRQAAAELSAAYGIEVISWTPI